MKKRVLKKIARNSIQRRIFLPMAFLIALQTLLVISVVFGSGVIRQLHSNASDVLYERVSSRKTYLENTMVNTWSNVRLTVQNVNERTRVYAAENGLDPTALEHNPNQSAALLSNIGQDLISMMRSNAVTGGFVVFNHSDLDEKTKNGAFDNKVGLYLRDMDPTGGVSLDNGDLLVECGSTSVVRALGISTSPTWDNVFQFNKQGAYAPYLYKPFQNALHLGAAAGEMDLADLGYWSPPYSLGNEESTQAIFYSVPLILEDGTVYGVLGVEITLEYLKSFLPNAELHEQAQGSYFLATGKKDSLDFEAAVINGSVLSQTLRRGETGHLVENKIAKRSFYLLNAGEEESDKQFCALQDLNLYNSNTAFSDERWALSGAVRSDDLFQFSRRIELLLLSCISVTALLGLGLAVFISFYIARPVMNLSEEMERANPRGALRLRRTKIREIDQLATSLEKVSQDVIDSANKFTRIMEMSSARLSGFEIDRAQQRLFVTEKFFDIFEINGIQEEKLTVAEFVTYMETLKRYYQPEESKSNEYVFKIHTSVGNTYVRLTIHDDGKHCYGLAEDVTRMITERQVIEHERDYDLLTGLINRRAFNRTMNQLFQQGEETLGVAALLMLDLDNLKQINDNYGHDCGDMYIQCAAAAFKRYVPAQAIVSRISGDEFYVFLYGYSSKKEVLDCLHRLKKGIDQTICQLPGWSNCQLRLSGGYAWYPEDSDNYIDLLRYSDFAMYKVKQSDKGNLARFSRALYDSEAYLIQNKSDLIRLIDEQAVVFYFQPIVDAQTGRIFAYEALMRSNIPTLRMPVDILRLALLEHKLNQIEILTWFKAMEAFADHLATGAIAENCKIFINSIGDQILPTEKIDELVARYENLMHRVVMEITEEQRAEGNLQEIKMQVMKSFHSGIALDDFGSGYNSEKNLLDLNPDYVKIDISIIRDIDRDKKKQMLLSNIVNYAHKGGMKVVAEGVETYSELKMSVDLGVDYLQGFYLERPSQIPPVLPVHVIEDIKRANEEELF